MKQKRYISIILLILFILILVCKFTRPSFRASVEFYQTAKTLTLNVQKKFDIVTNIDYNGFMQNLNVDIYVNKNMKGDYVQSDLIYEYVRDNIEKNDEYINLRKDFYYITSGKPIEYSDDLIYLLKIHILNEEAKQNLFEEILNKPLKFDFSYLYEDHITAAYEIVSYDHGEYIPYIRHDKKE